MRAFEFITGHVIYNQAYTYKFQLKTTYIPVTQPSITPSKWNLYDFSAPMAHLLCRNEQQRE